MKLPEFLCPLASCAARRESLRCLGGLRSSGISMSWLLQWDLGLLYSSPGVLKSVGDAHGANAGGNRDAGTFATICVRVEFWDPLACFLRKCHSLGRRKKTSSSATAPCVCMCVRMCVCGVCVRAHMLL